MLAECRTVLDTHTVWRKGAAESIVAAEAALLSRARELCGDDECPST
jgi:hypothetical protein